MHRDHVAVEAAAEAEAELLHGGRPCFELVVVAVLFLDVSHEGLTGDAGAREKDAPGPFGIEARFIAPQDGVLDRVFLAKGLVTVLNGEFDEVPLARHASVVVGDLGARFCLLEAGRKLGLQTPEAGVAADDFGVVHADPAEHLGSEVAADGDCMRAFRQEFEEANRRFRDDYAIRDGIPLRGLGAGTHDDERNINAAEVLRHHVVMARNRTRRRAQTKRIGDDHDNV